MIVSLLTPGAGKGKALCDLLRRELDIPENCVRFSVTFELDDDGVVVVNCTYMPSEQPGADDA